MSARISLIAAQKSSCSARPKTCAHSRKLRRYRVRSCVAKRPSQPHSFASCAQESIVCDRTVVLAIHRAIHTRPLPTSVSLPGGDALVARDIIDTLLQGAQAISPTNNVNNDPVAEARVYENVD